MEYNNIIFYYELSPTALSTTKEEYDECRVFIEFFKGCEDVPIKKLGNVFKEVVSNNICTIQ